MPRPKGLPKTGGRQAGSPNKDNPLKQLLHDHSMEYFKKNIPAEDAFPEKDRDMMGEQYADRVYSQFEIDLMDMKAVDRAKLEVELLAYHTPKMQAISADLAVRATNITISERIRRLAAGEEIPSGNED